jgi:hypothetical protein
MTHQVLDAFLKEFQRLLLEKVMNNLFHLSMTGIRIPWVPASVAQICGSHRVRGPDCTLDAPVPPNANAASWSWSWSLCEIMRYRAIVCTSLSPLFLTYKHCCTWPAFAHESPLVNSSLWQKTESQQADPAWTDVECDMPYFVCYHMPLCWTVTLMLMM